MLILQPLMSSFSPTRTTLSRGVEWEKKLLNSIIRRQFFIQQHLSDKGAMLEMFEKNIA